MADVDEVRGWGRIALITCPAIVVLGWASGWLSGSGYGNRWFDGLQKPFFMPPGWAFPVAWTALYLLMGAALAMVLALAPSPRRRAALFLFGLQFVLNLAWSPIFFAVHDIGLAKIVIFVMTVLAAAAAGQFLRLRTAAGLLLVPYLGWLLFAATLNATIQQLNPNASVPLLG